MQSGAPVDFRGTRLTERRQRGGEGLGWPSAAGQLYQLRGPISAHIAPTERRNCSLNPALIPLTPACLVMGWTHREASAVAPRNRERSTSPAEPGEVARVIRFKGRSHQGHRRAPPNDYKARFSLVASSLPPRALAFVG